MLEHSPINIALARMDTAISELESNIISRLANSADERLTILQDELSRLNDDRANLGVSLDNLTAYAKTLETTHKDVSDRLDSAISTIRVVLEAHGG